VLQCYLRSLKWCVWIQGHKLFHELAKIKCSQELGCGGMDWIELAQDRDRWGVRVNVVMNLRVL
jgi:hypothetical protein